MPLLKPEEVFKEIRKLQKGLRKYCHEAGCSYPEEYPKSCPNCCSKEFPIECAIAWEASDRLDQILGLIESHLKQTLEENEYRPRIARLNSLSIWFLSIWFHEMIKIIAITDPRDNLLYESLKEGFYLVEETYKIFK
jgi:hypothetical protein